MDRFSEFLFIKKLKGFFTQGTSPKGLAASVSLGVVFGIFPVFGVTTWVSTIIGVRFKLNVPLILAVLYIVWPIQLGLIVPFLRLGEWLFEVPPFALSLEKIQSAFEADFWAAMRQFWDANLYAVTGWFVIALPTGFLLYFLLKYIFRRFLRKPEILHDGFVTRDP